ncbi:DNA polymerase [Paramuricea clavata]|uniref:DNA-directed DNA polymerase n=1 Tax=Paramuricea clavata TaxID=317549 RepID=A0A6S7I918_PARCT|nr:DNA polymerase [Paramuricea clavata]
MELIQRVLEWGREHRAMGFIESIGDSWTPTERQRFLDMWKDDERKRYCHTCKKGYDKVIDHLCADACKSCRFPNCPIVSWLPCVDCMRVFKSQECFDRHKQTVGSAKSICGSLAKCPDCHTVVKRGRLRQHHCGLTRCSTCKEYVCLENHQCYIQPEKERNTAVSEDTDLLDTEAHDGDDAPQSGYNELLFFDFECRQENGNHEPNLCVVQNEAGDEWVFEGDNTRNEFCEWLFTKEHANCIVLAHNFQGYDGYFIQQYLHENGVIPEVIMRGATILTLNVPMFKIKFVDSLSFIPMRLADFPKTLGLNELAKGCFPHLFNTAENQNYVGPLPPSPFYHPDGMSPDEKEKFLEWHNGLKENNYVFDFQQEILTHCRSDVDILRRCCLEFRELFRGVTDIDPFEKCLTIASACNFVFRKNFLKENTIAIIPPHGYRPKDKQSLLAIKWLSYKAEKEDLYIQHARNAGEKRVGNYLLDGYDEETNTAYEINGCFWHGCLKCYSRDTINPVNGKTMQDLHQTTVEKMSYLKDQGFRERNGTNQDMKCYKNPLEPRDAFFGGRTNTAKLFHECKDGEKIRYVDFTSLYPWCNKMTRTVIGHPRIITENFEDISTYFGLIKCTVLPPRGLFHPVLPYRTQGKLIFPLCKLCADTCNQTPCTHSDNERAIQGTWCSVELEKALEKGYRILQLNEVWHFSKSSDRLFKEYVDTFLKIKQESRGYPKNCTTEEQRQQYVDEYLAVEGIQLDRSKIEHNPGMRALSKLMLNSFWGKFAQRANMAKVELISDVQTPNSKTNVVIAAFTTAYARLKLYEVLDQLNERVLYYDTDSVIFVSKPGESEPPLGPYLGQLTDELKEGHITTFIYREDLKITAIGPVPTK